MRLMPMTWERVNEAEEDGLVRGYIDIEIDVDIEDIGLG